MFKSPLEMLESGSVVVLWKVVITSYHGVEVLWRGETSTAAPEDLCGRSPLLYTNAVCHSRYILLFCAVYFFAVEALQELGCQCLCPPGSCWGTAALGALHGLTP